MDFDDHSDDLFEWYYKRLEDHVMQLEQEEDRGLVDVAFAFYIDHEIKRRKH